MTADMVGSWRLKGCVGTGASIPTRADARLADPPDFLMDALSDLLQVVKLNGALFLEGRFTAPWCIESHSGHESTGVFAGSEHIVFFHVITRGRCRVRLGSGVGAPR